MTPNKCQMCKQRLTGDLEQRYDYFVKRAGVIVRTLVVCRACYETLLSSETPQSQEETNAIPDDDADGDATRAAVR